MNRKLRNLLYWLEGGVISGFLWLVRRLDVETASNLFGWLARTLGPLLPVTNKGDLNLRLAMPELSEAERKRILRGVWDNLGRTVAEFPHLGDLGESNNGPGWVIEGREIIASLAASPGPAVLVGAHFANWETNPAVLGRLGLRLGFFYRAASNPVADRIILELRERATGRKLPNFPKGAQGARQAVMHLAKGGHLGILADQKLNNGIEARLFGHPAWTAPAAAAFALKYKAPMIPMHTVRLGVARFKFIAEPPLDLPNTGSNDGDVAALTQAFNDRLEAWVRANPEQWLWLHRRWPKEVTNAVT